MPIEPRDRSRESPQGSSEPGGSVPGGPAGDRPESRPSASKDASHASGAGGGDAALPDAVPEILRGASPRAILDKLIDGDVLEIGPRCRDEMSAMAYLVEPSRLHLRAVARIAHAAPGYTGDPPLATWIRDIVHRSLDELLQEDLSEDVTSIPDADRPDSRYQFLGAILGIEPLLARHACVSFNALPIEVRRTWWALAVEQKSVNRWVAEGNGPPSRVRERLRRAMRALGLPRVDGDDKGGLLGG